MAHEIYRNMVKKLGEKDRKRRKRVSKKDRWSLYVLHCADGKFYTGIAKDVQARLEKHQAGKGARFTRARLPVELIYQETCGSRSRALIRELEMKALPRRKKEALILA